MWEDSFAKEISLLKMPLPVMEWWNVECKSGPSFFDTAYFSIKRLYIDLP